MKRAPNIVERSMPALLMATSVTLLTAGLLSYAPSAFGDWQTPAPELADGDPLLTIAPDARPSGRPSAHTSSRPGPSDEEPTPSGVPLNPSARPTSASTPAPDRGVASRIRIPSLGIDLPVVAGDLDVPGNQAFYPLCDVAMYMPDYVQPAEEGATYIYAHAQRGMFAPLLKASQSGDGAAMIGALIEVYSSDDVLHLYEIYEVKRHALDLSLATTNPGEHILVLQTSEGPSGTIPKLQVAARPLSVVTATHAEANPGPQPRVCLPRS
jgi:hypothetical protein